MNNPVAELEWRNFIRRRLKRDNNHFGQISTGDWSGAFFRRDKHPRRWSQASRLEINQEDWDRELPPLLDRIARDELAFIKQGNSGDVLSTTLTLGGKSIDVVIKRPKRRYWYRYINQIWRGTRARREWFKAWKMIVRNIPTAWPLLYVEKWHAGYVTDGLIIFEKIEGPMLARVQLDELNSHDRDMLLRRAGRILRRIDRLGFSHFDAKASNWIVRMDEKLGPFPMLVDIDGIRHRRWTALGVRRLLKSMQENKQYTPADSLSLCQGYTAGTGVQPVPEEAEDVSEPAN
jgi:tRNA A-37 threonylcarbamoyl transferase component Bud32